MLKSPTPKPKIVVVAGPTASGKSGLAVELARKFNGEIISADSRQVYYGMDIGSGKVTKFERRGVPHHLLSVANPMRRFTVAQYKRRALKAMRDVLRRGKLPIICGGTGFYIDALVYDFHLPDIKPNRTLRAKLEKKSLGELTQLLQEKDPARAENIDLKNKVRLVRALEIVLTSGKPVPPILKKNLFDSLWLGIKVDEKMLRKKIHDRLIARVRRGMIAEVKRLIYKRVSLKRLEELGLEYRYAARYLRGEISKKEMLIELEKEIAAYAKRQMTWFKRNKEIKWIKDLATAEVLVKKSIGK